MDDQACENTDREIWCERPGDAYSDRVFVTKGGGIGMNVGGNCIVKPIRDWFMLAAGATNVKRPATIAELESILNSEEDRPFIIHPDGSISEQR